MLHDFNKTPQNMTGDNEFKTHDMMSFADQYDFLWYFSDPHEKYRTAIAERVIKTIKSLIKRYTTENNTTNYVDVIQDLVYNYNHTQHETIGTTPHNAITTGQTFYDEKYTSQNISQLPLGSMVRILLKLINHIILMIYLK
jgi:hypothetical protein